MLDIIKSVPIELPFRYAAAVKRKEDSALTLLKTCGKLANADVDVDIIKINGPGGKFLPSFPTYLWDHQIISRECRSQRKWRLRRFPRHDMLGSLVPALSQDIHVWRNIISSSQIP